MQIITVEELKAKMDRGENLQLLDVREPSEHAEFNIGGILLPLGNIMRMQVEDIEEWKDKEVICYCRSGNRSGQACQYLDMQGFSNTKNLAGGMIAWMNATGATSKAFCNIALENDPSAIQIYFFDPSVHFLHWLQSRLL